MALKDHSFRTSYNKIDHDIAKEFYLPCMRNAIRYDRATGYFSSSIYILSWSYLKEFVTNGGKMRVVCSPYLAVKDQDAIEEGTISLSSEEQRDNLFKEFEKIFKKDTLSAPERVLACLIAKGIMEIKIAVGKYDPNRLFHDKVGLFYDTKGSVVAFRGSVNETFKGLPDDGNFESLDVFETWRNKSEEERVIDIQHQFERVWQNQNDKIVAIELPKNIKELVAKHATKESTWTEALDEVLYTIDKASIWSADKRPNGKRPREHQLNALDAWEKNFRRGIFEHATGSGKTFSAMCAIRKCIEEGSPVIILVPSVGLLDQWHRELKEVFSDLDVQYLLCGGGFTDWKREMVLRAFTDTCFDEKRITIAVMETAASPDFYNQVVSSDKLFLVADEVHRMGSENRRRIFTINAGRRLGLSATPKRYGDPVGTECIFNYFGGIVGQPYTLKNAIDDNVLCHYFYFPHIVSLNKSEQEEWDEISKKISKFVARLSSQNEDNIMSNNQIKKLLIQRSRIIKNADAKIKLAYDVLRNDYKEGDRWIVYCDNHAQLNDVLTRLLNAGMRAYEYHSELGKDKKEQTLKYFSTIGGIIVSIRCLDEGIDIPNTTHALILASSQNPREFVQRRGRILRKSNNKNFSYLHDAIVIPDKFASSDKAGSIIEMELVRSIQFGEWSEDSKCIVDLKLLAIDNNIDYNNIKLSSQEYE